ncbi:MAG: hypothetical protein ACOZE5_18860 [Verrucomicrobiota bacterium]
MKPIQCLSFGLLASFVLFGGARAAEEVSAYQRAVNAYVEAAGKELQALKHQVGETLKDANEETKAAYKEFLGQLEKYETAFAGLKVAAPQDFDRAKALYEKRRKEALTALAQIKAG